MSGHALITGSSGGIGLALCRSFVDKGWLVTGFDVSAPALCGGSYVHEQIDVSDELAMITAFERAAGRTPLRAVIANAAVTDVQHRGVADLDFKSWQRILRANADGGFLTAKLAARHMNRGGNVIFITSSLAFFDHARANDAPYCASKSAIEMLMRVLALELANQGTNVNTVYPSDMVDTGFFAHLGERERAKLAPPDLLNNAALFLAELEPGALTGVSLDQQRWDTDTEYRQSIERKASNEQANVS